MKLRGEFSTRRVWLDGKELTPVFSQAIRNHSPDGFNWGYSGSGPAQLALAILLELGISQSSALQLYQGFKEQYIATLPQADFDIKFMESFSPKGI